MSVDDFSNVSRAANVTSYPFPSKARTPDNAADEVASRPVRPRSAVPQLVGLVGLASLAVAFLIVILWRPADRNVALAVLLLSLAVPMITLDTMLNRQARVARRLAPSNPARVAIKLCGFAATLAVIGLAYWLFPNYRDQQARALISQLALFWPLLVLIPAYIWFTDRVMDEPEDGLYMAGLAALGQWKAVDRPMLRQYAMGWLVKGFFLPLMLWNSWGNLDLLLTSPMDAIRAPPYGWYEFAYGMILFVDVLFASAGYFCTFRLFGLHIRWAEETAFGWMVCLICYAPFADTLFRSYLPYNETDHGWGYWFGPATAAGSVWAAMILIMLATHIWATVIFGIRFSNLTNRGIITNGPYRWSKHPAYITKMIMYCMIWLPFLSPSSIEDALRKSLAFSALAGIYFLRAKAEEAYLMQDPDYRAYARFIACNGLIAMARRWLNERWENRRVCEEP